MTKTTKSKMLSFLLCFVMIATTFCQTAMTVRAEETKDITITDAQGTAVQDVTLPKNGPKDQKTKLTAKTGVSADAKYQWQILADADSELWVDIRGEKAAEISVSYPMVRNLIDKDTGSTSLRCRIKDGRKTLTSDAVRVTAGEKVRAEAAANPTKAEIRKAAAKTATPATPQADDEITAANDGEENSTYSIIINYVFADGKQAANPWTATVAKGSDYNQTVTSPTVVGYAPDQATVDVDVKDIQSDKTYTVTYTPAEVEYTVKHYQQNTDNDNYTLKDTETKKGYTESAVGDKLAKTYTGFTALLYDTTTKIAADGSTVVEIYYDRNYYLMTFDLDGGYGVEPIYARYGTKIEVDNTKLKKAGYTFDGWDKEIPATMPAENTAYKANWKATDKAKVTVVIWGENADDENYSYIDSNEIYAKPGTTIKYGSTERICGQEEHKHNASCGYACNKTEHTHSSACCSLESHTHDYTCYPNTASNTTNFGGIGWYNPPANPKQGQVHVRNFAWQDHKGIYIGNKWYEYNGDANDGDIITPTCGKTEHTHGNGCNHDKCEFTEEHTHSAACGYKCGLKEHTHDSGCYLNDSTMDANLWTYKDSDEVKVAADGTTIVNVYYNRTEFTLTFRANNNTVATIKDKWGAEISGEFSKAPFNTTYNGRAWKCTDSSKFSYALQTLDRMPKFDATFNLYNKSSNAKKTIYYYVQKVGATVSSTSWPTNATNFDLLKQVDTYFNYATYDEEYHEIQGFTRYSASVAGFGNNRKDFSNNRLNLYYMRNSYDLKFYNHDAFVDDKAKSVQYETPLKGYGFTPDYPSNLEPNAYEFAGWYTSPGCYDGSEVDWDKMTMPASDVTLYAKWAPKTHTVKTWLTDKMDTAVNVGDSNVQTVLHGSKATAPDEPKNGNYTFVGWFYKDAEGNEKAFDFSMPVNRDLDLYAKWSSNVLVEYTIKYTLGDGTVIATETKGSALAGTTKTFDAKTGTELKEGYQKGYFPKSSSHSITMDIDGDNVYTFVYVEKAKVKYTVRYLEKGTNTVLHEEKSVETSDAVITEKFVAVTGYRPDAYQKRLVLSAEEKDNVITFWYEADTEHAPVQIIHWTQNIAGEGYTEYQSSTDLNGVIGNDYSEDWLSIPGFTHNTDKSNTSGKLTADGLVLNLYYDRIEYPYEFRFLEQDTNKKLAEPVKGNARYQAQVTERAKDIPGYTLVSPENQAISIAIEDPDNVAKKNMKTFYYTEQTVDIKYQVVGPNGCGTLDNYQDNTVKVVTGSVKGSAPTPAKGYKFVGWYKDEACTTAVDSDWIDANKKLTPKQEGTDPAMYKAATYYAKFEKDVADLTIKKTGCSDADTNQSFIFDVKDKNGKLITTVTIHGNSSATIKDLQIGEYTVTENTKWSWRYEPTKNDQTITLDVDDTNEVTFVNERKITNWLNGSSWCKNAFKDGKITQTRTTTNNSED